MADSISQPVGTGATNGADDVRTVQRLLARASELTGDAALHPGPVDGVCGDGTEGAVARFQRRIGLRPDGRVDAGGYTWRRLAALLAIGDLALRFPFPKRPDRPFVGAGAGMRSFGWRRDGGRRAHAGVDLYFPEGTPVLAVADGVVRRAAPFYLRTEAVEVEHCGADGRTACVARYGEVSSRVEPGDRVSAGDVVGTVAQMVYNDGRRFAHTMLHFELYDDTCEGALTDQSTRCARHTDGRPFYRRRDLVDPSGILSAAPLPG